jgi:preprotein translocase subunit Sec61beta
MIKEGLSAPSHAGAVKYYKERDWMKQNILSAIQARKCAALSE